MKSRLLRSSMALAVLAMPAGLAIPVPLVAQHLKDTHATDRFPRYVVQDLGTLGGPYSFSYNLNDEGVVSGGSATATQNGDPSQAIVNAPQTAFLWDRGHLQQSRYAGRTGQRGCRSQCSRGSPQWTRKRQTSAGKARMSAHLAPTLQCLAAIWKNGRLSALPLLPGGNNSYALDLNDRGQVVGFSDTDVYDLDCAAAKTRGLSVSSRDLGAERPPFDSLRR